MTFSFGTLTFLKLSPAVLEQRCPSFGMGCADGYPLPILFQQERADPLVLLFRIDRREHRQVIRHAGIVIQYFVPFRT